MEQREKLIISDYQSIEQIIKKAVEQKLDEKFSLLLDVIDLKFNNKPALMTKKEAAATLGINYRTLQKLIAHGAIQTTPDGKKIIRASLNEYVNNKQH